MMQLRMISKTRFLLLVFLLTAGKSSPGQLTVEWQGHFPKSQLCTVVHGYFISCPGGEGYFHPGGAYFSGADIGNMVRYAEGRVKAFTKFVYSGLPTKIVAGSKIWDVDTRFFLVCDHVKFDIPWNNDFCEVDDSKIGSGRRGGFDRLVLEQFDDQIASHTIGDRVIAVTTSSTKPEQRSTLSTIINAIIDTITPTTIAAVESKVPEAINDLKGVLNFCSFRNFQNCFDTRGKRYPLKEEVIENLKKDKDWSYPLLIDGLSSFQLMAEKFPNTPIISADKTNYRLRCKPCVQMSFNIQFANLTHIIYGQSVSTTSGLFLSSDCKSTRKLTDKDCEGRMTSGVSHSLSCTDYVIDWNQKDRFFKMNHDFESDVCSLGGLTVRTCSSTAMAFRTYIVGIVDGRYKIFKNGGVITRTTHKSNGSYIHDPPGCGDGCLTGVSACTGDEYFCSEWGCDTASTCRLEYNYLKSAMALVTQDGDEYLVQCVARLTMRVSYEVTKNKLDEEAVMKDEQMRTQLDVECGKEGLTISSSSLMLISGTACSHHHCVSSKMREGKLTLSLPEGVRVKTHTVTLKILAKGIRSPISFREVCKAINFCSIITCNYCLQKLMNPSCFTTLDYLILIVTVLTLAFVISILAMLAILFSHVRTFFLYVGKAFYFLIKIILKAIRLLFKYLTMVLPSSLRNHFRNLDSYLSEGSNNEPLIPLSSSRASGSGESASARRSRMMGMFSRRHNQGLDKKVLSVSILMLLSKDYRMVETCSISNTVETKTSRCEFNTDSTLKECEITTDMDTKLVGIGTESCLELKSTTGLRLGFLKISLLEISDVCVVGDTYFTPDIVSKVDSAVVCRLTEFCKDELCEETKKNGTKMPFEYNLITQPGVNYCTRGGTGFLVDGCLWPADACVYYRHFFANPTARSNRVFRCSRWSTEIRIKLQFIQEDSKKSFSKDLQVLIGQETTVQEGVTISLTGVDKTFEMDMLNCFVERESELYYTPCNQRGVFTIGSLGEVQCPTKSAAEQMTSQCQYDDRIFSSLMRDNNIKDTTKLLDNKKVLSEDDKLPLHISDFLLTSRSGIPMIGIEPSTQISVKLSFSGTRVSVASREGSCFVNFKSLSGCYSCREGATLSLKVKSDKYDLLTTVTCGGPSIQFVSKPVETQEDLHMSFSNSRIVQECSYRCGSKEGSFKIEGDLHFVKLESKFIESEGWIQSFRKGGKLAFDLGFDLFDFNHGYFTVILIIIGVIGFAYFFKLLLSLKKMTLKKES